MTNFNVSSSPGGVGSASNVQSGDFFPYIDASSLGSSIANKIMTFAELRKVMGRLRPDGSIKTPPLVSEIGTIWNWVNQSSASAEQDPITGGLLVSAARTSGYSLKMLTRSLFTAPSTVTVELDSMLATIGTAAFGIGMRESSSGKVVTFAHFNDSGFTGGSALVSMYFLTVNTWSTNGIWCTNHSIAKQPRFLRITDSGSMISCYYSHDGSNFINVKSGGTSKTGTITPDQFVLFVDPSYGSDPNYGGAGVFYDVQF